MFNCTAVTFFYQLPVFTNCRFYCLLPDYYIGLESALWLLVRELRVSRGMQKHWLDVLPHTRVQCVVKCEFCISFLSNSLYLFQFNESVDHLTGELCS